MAQWNIATMIDHLVDDSEEQFRTLREAEEKPHVLDLLVQMIRPRVAGYGALPARLRSAFSAFSFHPQ